MTFSGYLIEWIEETKKKEQCLSFTPGSLTANFRFLYWSVIASEMLLLEAARALDKLPADPFNTRLGAYYRSHFEEEKGESEILATDLKNARVTLGIPNGIAVAMIGSQYYFMHHTHPASLLGYMAVVEAVPTPMGDVERLEEAYGKEFFSFVRFHAVRDLEHRVELIELLDASPGDLHETIRGSCENVLFWLGKAVKSFQDKAHG